MCKSLQVFAGLEKEMYSRRYVSKARLIPERQAISAEKSHLVPIHMD